MWLFHLNFLQMTKSGSMTGYSDQCYLIPAFLIRSSTSQSNRDAYALMRMSGSHISAYPLFPKWKCREAEFRPH